LCIVESFCKSLFTLKGEGFYKSARQAYVEERRVILFLGRRNDNLSSGSIYTTTLLKAFKYALLPNDEQKHQLAKFLGSCRFVYNLGLETKRQVWASAASLDY
jgi:hypothetical protein